jgi:hypothetical protein
MAQAFRNTSTNLIDTPCFSMGDFDQYWPRRVGIELRLTLSGLSLDYFENCRINYGYEAFYYDTPAIFLQALGCDIERLESASNPLTLCAQ